MCSESDNSMLNIQDSQRILQCSEVLCANSDAKVSKLLTRKEFSVKMINTLKEVKLGELLLPW